MVSTIKPPCNTKIVKGQEKSLIMTGVSYQAPIQFTMMFLAIEAPGFSSPGNSEEFKIDPVLKYR